MPTKKHEQLNDGNQWSIPGRYIAIGLFALFGGATVLPNYEMIRAYAGGETTEKGGVATLVANFGADNNHESKTTQSLNMVAAVQALRNQNQENPVILEILDSVELDHDKYSRLDEETGIVSFFKGAETVTQFNVSDTDEFLVDHQNILEQLIRENVELSSLKERVSEYKFDPQLIKIILESPTFNDKVDTSQKEPLSLFLETLSSFSLEDSYIIYNVEAGRLIVRDSSQGDGYHKSVLSITLMGEANTTLSDLLSKSLPVRYE